MRFHLTVNDMAKTHLEQLDAFVNRFVKKWTGLPRPGTLSFIHMPEGCNIPTISNLYMECHALAHLSSRMKADETVNHCIDSRLERESKWKRKISHTAESERLAVCAGYTDPSTKHSAAKKVIKKSLNEQTSEFWREHVKSLTVQGSFLQLLSLEKGATHWRSIIYNLPHNVCKFLINSCSDTLNHNSNLMRWGKRTNDRCPRCGNKETLLHVLNFCKNSLEQGRFTWRHNNIINYLKEIISHSLTSSNTSAIINADLPNTYNGHTTVPTSIATTNLIPDICVYLKELSKVVIIELTVPFETNINKAHENKSNKYAPLMNDIIANGYEVDFFAIEIGSRGYINSENNSSLKKMRKLLKISTPLNKLKNCLSKLAIISSFVIFHAKSEPSWESPPFLSVNN